MKVQRDGGTYRRRAAEQPGRYVRGAGQRRDEYRTRLFVDTVAEFIRESRGDIEVNVTLGLRRTRTAGTSHGTSRCRYSVPCRLLPDWSEYRTRITYLLTPRSRIRRCHRPVHSSHRGDRTSGTTRPSHHISRSVLGPAIRPRLHPMLTRT